MKYLILLIALAGCALPPRIEVRQYYPEAGGIATYWVGRGSPNLNEKSRFQAISLIEQYCGHKDYLITMESINSSVGGSISAKTSSGMSFSAPVADEYTRLYFLCDKPTN